MHNDLRTSLTRSAIEKALSYIDGGGTSRLDRTSDYVLQSRHNSYQLTQVIGIASKWAIGEYLQDEDLPEDLDKWCVSTLRMLGYSIRKTSGTDNQKIWIENVLDCHEQLSPFWRIGERLIAPINLESNSANLIKNIKSGDLVLHCQGGEFVGLSEVALECLPVICSAPQKGQWKGCRAFFEVTLRDFRRFSKPVPNPGGEANDYICVSSLDALDHVSSAAWSRESDEISDSMNVWLVSIGRNRKAWHEFSEKSIVALAADHLGDLSHYPSASSIEESLVAEGICDSRDLKKLTDAYFSFRSGMVVGSWIALRTGGNEIVGLGRVTSDYFFDSTERRHVRSVEWLSSEKRVIPNFELSEDDSVQKVELNRYLHPGIRNVLNASGLEFSPNIVTKSQCISNIFIPKGSFDEIVASLEMKKNIILQGPPGVGKTFVARVIANCLMGVDDNGKVELVQFHQSYAYEDFIQGWKPNKNGGFEIRNGIFYEFCNRARLQPKKRHVFIIDEINRGNLSRIFGELLLLIEADKRGYKHAIPLTYAPSEVFCVPPNVFIIGLMNTADKSVSSFDYALRRRFTFFTVDPCFSSPEGAEKFKSYLISKNVTETCVEKIIRVMTDLNQHIASKKYAKRLGKGFQIGHSYFCPSDDRSKDDTWFEQIWQHEIIPILQDYGIDDDEIKKVAG